MILDLLVRSANLADGRSGVDIGIRHDRIVAMAENLPASAATEVDARGKLVTAPFIDAHFHFDTALTLGFRGSVNVSGTLAEGIEKWRELRPHFSADALKTRAQAYCRLAIGKGTLAIRSHIDVSDDSLMAAEVMLDVRREFAGSLDIQLVAFPQQGYFGKPSMPDNVRRALLMGFDAVGGIPNYEPTPELGRQSIVELCALGAQRGVRVDMHCDENDDPHSQFVRSLAQEAARLGLHERATGSHLCSMHSMSDADRAEVISLICASRLSAVANPLANMVLQGRGDSYPKRRGMMPVPEMIEAGCLVALGHDSVQDLWYPLGTANMLDVGQMAVHAAHMTSRKGMADCFKAVTDWPARILGLDGYGLTIGSYADMVILDAPDVVEALRVRPTCEAVIRRGRIVAKTRPAETSLRL